MAYYVDKAELRDLAARAKAEVTLFIRFARAAAAFNRTIETIGRAGAGRWDAGRRLAFAIELERAMAIVARIDREAARTAAKQETSL
jgi:hypothetical protein